MAVTVDTGSETLDLGEGEDTVLGGVSGGDSEVGLDSLHNLIGVAEHAGSGGADLEVVLSDGVARVHGVESGDLCSVLN